MPEVKCRSRSLRTLPEHPGSTLAAVSVIFNRENIPVRRQSIRTFIAAIIVEREKGRQKTDGIHPFRDNDKKIFEGATAAAGTPKKTSASNMALSKPVFSFILISYLHY